MLKQLANLMLCKSLRRRTGTTVISPLALLLAGCYAVQDVGEAKVYGVELWVPFAVIFAGLALIGLGILAFRKWHRGLGVMLCIIGPVMMLAIPPMLLLNKVTVDAKHLEVVDCFLWNIERANIDFDQLLGARLDVQKIQTRSAGEVTKYTLELTMKEANPQSIVVKNALKTAWPEIARQLRTRGFNKLPERLPE